MNYTVLIHTHSDYSYLWPIINDYIKKYNFTKILAYNNIPENTILPDCFDRYIQYDDTQKFTGRLCNILEQIEEEFVFLIYDVDIIINIDEGALENYINIMRDNQIDRLNIAVFDGTEYIQKNNYAICNLNKNLRQPSNHFTPIDCNPTIWNKKTCIDFLKKFPNETYNSFDLNDQIISYCKTNMKCYGIQLTPNLKILYNRGLTYCDKISLLHITVKGKFLVPFQCYADYQNDLIKIINNYKLDINQIGTIQAHAGCFNNKKLSIRY